MEDDEYLERLRNTVVELRELGLDTRADKVEKQLMQTQLNIELYGSIHKPPRPREGYTATKSTESAKSDTPTRDRQLYDAVINNIENLVKTKIDGAAFEENLRLKYERDMAYVKEQKLLSEKFLDAANFADLSLGVANLIRSFTKNPDKIMRILGYTPVYHGSFNKFPLKKFRSSWSNFGLHVSPSYNKARGFIENHMGIPQKAYIKNSDKIPEVVDFPENNYDMFNPEWVPERFPRFTEDFSAHGIYFKTHYPQYLRNARIGGLYIKVPESAVINKPFNMLKLNWPNMPESARLKYDKILSDVKSGSIRSEEANTAVANLLKENKIPLLKYKNAYEFNQNLPYDYIITDPKAIITLSDAVYNKASLTFSILGGIGAGVGGLGVKESIDKALSYKKGGILVERRTK